MGPLAPCWIRYSQRRSRDKNILGGEADKYRNNRLWALNSRHGSALTRTNDHYIQHPCQPNNAWLHKSDPDHNMRWICFALTRSFHSNLAFPDTLMAILFVRKCESSGNGTPYNAMDVAYKVVVYCTRLYQLKWVFNGRRCQPFFTNI